MNNKQFTLKCLELNVVLLIISDKVQSYRREEIDVEK